jgi:hypothetical protein
MSDRIEKLIAYIPQFESGEEPTSDNWFMDFYHLALEECQDISYRHCFDRLTDFELIKKASLNELKPLLMGVCRSEYWLSADYSGHVWRDYNRQGTFTAILRRLDELEKEAK